MVALAYEDRDWKSSAWILIDETNPGVTLAPVLAELGHPILLHDYIRVASVTWAPTGDRLYLLRPRHP
jgi:hypothetical protein